MAETLKLSIVLDFKNNASKGIAAFVSQLQMLKSEGKGAISVLNSLQKAFDKQTGAPKRSKPDYSGELKGLRDLQKEAKKTRTALDSVTSPTGKRRLKAAGTDELTVPTRRRKRGTEGPLELLPDNDQQARRITRRGRRPDPFEQRQTFTQKAAILHERYLEPARQITGVVKSQAENLSPYIDSAMRVSRAEAQFKLLNLSPDQNIRALKAVDDQIKQLGLTTRSEGIASILDLHTATGELDHAIENLGLASKYKFSMEALYGDKYSKEQLETQLQNSFKFLELTGKVSRGQAETEKGFNAITQMANATGGRVTGEDMLAMARTGRVSLQNLSGEGLSHLAAPIQGMGASQTGTALMSMYRTLVGGKMTQRSRNEFLRLGLLDESKITTNPLTGAVQTMAPGANRLGELMQEDPLKVFDALRVAMEKKGIDTKNENKANEELALLFGRSTEFGLASVLMNQRNMVVKDAGIVSHSQDVGQMFNTAMEGPGKIILWEKAIERFREQAGGPLLETLTKLVGAAQPLMHIFAAAPQLTAWGFGAIFAAKGLSTFTEAASVLSGRDKLSFFRDTKSDLSRFGETIRSESEYLVGFGRSAKDAEKKVEGFGGKLKGLASSPMAKIGLTIGAIAVAEQAVTYLYEHIQADLDQKAKNAELRVKLTGLVDDILITGEAGKKTERTDALSAGFFNSIEEGGQLKRVLKPETASWGDRIWDSMSIPGLTKTPYGIKKQSSLLEMMLDPQGVGKKNADNPLYSSEGMASRWAALGMGQNVRDPQNAANLLRDLPKWGASQGYSMSQMQTLAEAVKSLTLANAGPEKWQKDDKWAQIIASLKESGSKDILTLLETDKPVPPKSQGQIQLFGNNAPPLFGSIPGPFVKGEPIHPFGSLASAYDPPKTPLTGSWDQSRFGNNFSPFHLSFLDPPSAKKPFAVDKPSSQFTAEKPKVPLDTQVNNLIASGKTKEAFALLSQHANDAANDLDKINPSTQTVAESFTKLQTPVDNSTNAFSQLYDAAKQTPAAVLGFNAATLEVSGALGALAQILAAWKPPAAPGVPGAVVGPGNIGVITPPSNAVGGHVHDSGLAFIHSGETVVPARSVAYRETVNHNTVNALYALHKTFSQRPPRIVNVFAIGSEKGDPPSAGPATPNFTVPGFAVGAESVTQSGLAFIHSNEEIIPARATAYREKVNHNTLNAVTDLHRSFEQTQPNINYIFAGEGSAQHSKDASTVPSRAVGGIVERDGMAYVHGGNVITPARVTKGLSGFESLMKLKDSGRATNIFNYYHAAAPVNSSYLSSVQGDVDNSQRSFKRGDISTSSVTRASDQIVPSSVQTFRDLTRIERERFSFLSKSNESALQREKSIVSLQGDVPVDQAKAFRDSGQVNPFMDNSVLSSFAYAEPKARREFVKPQFEGDRRNAFPVRPEMRAPPEFSHLHNITNGMIAAGHRPQPAARPSVTVTAPIHVTINGAKPEAVKQFRDEIHKHKREIIDIVTREIDNRVQRA